ncbi:MAG: cobyrinate a,c-diamide synthase [Thermodesulfovibrionales bacterium]|nr:cobyrinate a,c-diamide synthase [Thermodesulfovibrionales bacterium]
MNGFIIAGTHSGCGKTTITLGIIAALKKKGLSVQPFKTGPDFIDSGIHRLVTGRHSMNLDVWMCGEKYVKECFYKYSTDADIAVIEGVMGMYDGEYSTAKLAGLLNLPVILVVDAYGMAESAGAVIAGFTTYKRVKGSKGQSRKNSDTLTLCNSDTNIAGVIFNRVASERHYEKLKRSVSDIKVLGYLPRDLDFEIPRRHLGLIVAEETPISGEMIETLADTVLRHIDMDRIVELPNTSMGPSFPLVGNPSSSEGFPENIGTGQTSRNDTDSPIHPFTHSPVIAVAYDKAFCFYYEDNLDLLKSAGAEIIAFSPLADPQIPDKTDAVYIGGGYPELYAEELSKNKSMLKSIKEWADAGRTLYAECGGLMYLSKGIYDFDGKFFKMAGAFPFETEMKKGKSHLGYREILLKEDCILGKKGKRLRGHEFHYSEIVKGQAEGTVPDLRPETSGVESGLSPSARGGIINKIYSVRDNSVNKLADEGYTFKNTLASYIHIHFGSDSEIARNFLNHIKEQRWRA